MLAVMCEVQSEPAVHAAAAAAAAATAATAGAAAAAYAATAAAAAAATSIQALGAWGLLASAALSIACPRTHTLAAPAAQLTHPPGGASCLGGNGGGQVARHTEQQLFARRT